jgi:hypothetical protein
MLASSAASRPAPMPRQFGIQESFHSVGAIFHVLRHDKTYSLADYSARMTYDYYQECIFFFSRTER